MAWFEDVKLEKALTTNQWNILTVVFRSVDAPIVMDGKKTQYKHTISDAEVQNMRITADAMPELLESASGGLMQAKMDFATVSTPLIELKPYNSSGDQWASVNINGYMIDVEAKCFTEAIEPLLSKKQYNQIVVYTPLAEIAGGWAGLGGGMKYDGIAIALVNHYPTASESYNQDVILHEMLHGMEQESLAVNPQTPALHSASDFGYITGSREWYSAYMRAILPGGKGLDPSVYTVPSGKYKLISNDMTVGKGIKQSSAFPIKLTSLKVSKIADCTYNGKAQKPSVKITDGKYVLKKGIDYTVSYSSNTSVGKAKAVIKGKGIYSGQRTVSFLIVPNQPTVTVKQSGDRITVSWSKVSGADHYVIWCSKDGNAFEKLSQLGKDKRSLSIKYSSKHQYQFAVTAYIPATNAYIPYVYTDLV